ncbi:MAG TPA: hypothetical protein VG940_04405 [Gemmatimonadales bacterium]|nr:hypothetical protein [Gemmatimonadales bacterium]
MSDWTPATTRLVEIMGHTARGPKREGVYAVWLVVRAAETQLLDPPAAPKSRGRQLEGIKHRLATLTLPAPVRRAVATSLSLLAEDTPDAAASALHQLTAPARESLGHEVADALGHAIRAAKGPRQ